MGGFLTIGAGQGYSLPQIVFNILLTFLLTLFIAFTYKRLHRGLSYSQSFVFTLILVSVVVTVTMMVIGNNLAAAFGILGAFTIIRFRTAVKDTKDTGYLFFALVVGMAVGTNNYSIAVTATVLILLIMWFLNKINFGSVRTHEYLLTFLVNNANGGTQSFDAIFKKYLKHSMLLNIAAKQDGAVSEMTYNVNFIEQNKTTDFVRELSAVAGVERVHVITSNEDVEY